MFTIEGNANTAKVFTDAAEETACRQIRELCDQSWTAGSKIRIMPDVHAGAGCTIGTTMTITDKAVPNLVGVDIGCGLEVAVLKETHIEVQKLDKLIYSNIPSGFDVRETPHRFAQEFDLTELSCYDKINTRRALHSIGTLGGGNHFIEADKGSYGSVYIVIHSGSRHLGLEVAHWYQEEAFRRLNGCSKPDLDAVIAQMKAQGREKEIQSELTRLKTEIRTAVPRQLAYCEGELFDQYIHDMKLVQHFAMLNRKAMMDEIIRGMHLHVKEQFTTIHNYIDTDEMILRKGAVSAKKGEKLIIPINMRRPRLELLRSPRRRNTDVPEPGPEHLHRVGIQEADGRDLYHLSKLRNYRRVPHGLQADRGHR